ncbi:MAG: hypothetical protein KUG61_11105 [Parvibaculaceae bacterium]|nr:hypothetical protein [Parvibaculaceae bacterium]
MIVLNSIFMRRLSRSAAILFSALFVVACGGGSGGSAPVSEQLSTVDLNFELPITPIAPTASVLGNTVILSWDSIPDADSYTLYWSASSLEVINGVVNNIQGTTYTHENLSYGETYYYTLTASNLAGEGDASNAISVLIPFVAQPPQSVPAIPGSPVLTVRGNSIESNWEPVEDAESYTLYWSTSPFSDAGGTAILLQAPTYLHENLSYPNTYYYAVSASNALGESLVSDISSAQTDSIDPPEAPAKLSILSANKSVRIAWLPSENATEYDIYWSTDHDAIGNGNIVEGVTSPFHHASVENDTVYFYTVVARNSYGDSAHSTEVSALPTAPPRQVSAGTQFTCELYDNEVDCWGSDLFGTLDVPTLINPIHVSAGNVQSCAIDDDGVQCWPDASGSTPDIDNPYLVVTGGGHNCALGDGGVICWGANNAGQLDVPELYLTTALSSTGLHTCALASEGVQCWGANNEGQLDVPELSNPHKISTGTNHSCAVDDSGVVCWGDDFAGQGTGISLSSSVKQLSSSRDANCIILEEAEGGAHCWGNINPAFIQTKLESIDVGWNHVCAVDDNGVQCWGDNDNGQLGEPLSAPTGLRLSSDKLQLTVDWDVKDSADSYLLYFSETPVEQSTNARWIPTSQTQFVFDNLTLGETYYVVIAAYTEEAGVGEESPQLSITINGL